MSPLAPSTAEIGNALEPLLSRTAGRVVALAAALWLCMIPLRAMVIGYIPPQRLDLPPLSQIPKLLLSSVYDFEFVAILMLTIMAALMIFGRWRFARGLIFFGFALIAIVSIVWCRANVRIVPMLGSPFNYQWFYYSDFFRGLDAQQAIQDVLQDKVFGVPRELLYAVGSAGMMIALAMAIGFVWRRIVPRVVTGRPLIFVIVPLACAYIALGHWHVTKSQWSSVKLQNPVIFFAESLIHAHNAPQLLTMHTEIGTEDFRTVDDRPRSFPSNTTGAGAIRNIVLFVMESVPAEYIGAYGSKFPVTPELDKYRDRAAVFRNIYAHAPSTNMSMLSMLFAVYPMLSYSSITEEDPHVPLPSLSNELHQRGWRTGFFYGADLSYQKAGEFLKTRGFDFIEDGGQRRCDQKFESKEWAFLSGSDDNCTVESILQWIQHKPDQPFFAMAWTMMTHFPYFTHGEPSQYGVKDSYQAKYLNAVRCSDESLGKLLRALEERKLLDSTLVIVVGDHGEAFQQHGTYGHGSAIYEENLHVPLILINPKLFHGETYETIGGLSDVAPTVMDMLRLPMPGQWQGRSLWAPDRTGRVYFFAPWSELLFGYREGTRKLIFNATRNSFEVYDLSKDATETNNLASSSTDFVNEGQRRLAAWAQYQAKFYGSLSENLLAESGN